MRIEKTYFAFDDTEFDNEADCVAYEDECYQNMAAVAAYDWNLNFIEKPTEEQWLANIMYIKILDGRKAERFVRWLHEWGGMTCDGLYGDLRTGEVWMWDTDNATWIKPFDKLSEMQKVCDRISKAVNAS